MSATAKALMVKFLMTFVFGLLTLWLINGNTWGSIFIVTLFVTAINYVIGDLMMVPVLSNIVASISDGLVSALVAYLVAVIVVAFEVSTVSLLLYGTLIAVSEFFFHLYLGFSDKVEP